VTQPHDESTNPFAAPQSAAARPTPDVADGVTDAIPPEVAALLLSTRPWMMLFAVLSALTAIFLLIMTAIVVTAQRDANALVAVVVYVPFAAIYFLASYRLGVCASRIRAYATAMNSESLAVALVSLKSFWKFVGILAVAYVVLSVVSLVAAFTLPLLLAFS